MKVSPRSTLLAEVEAILNFRPLTPITFVEGSERPLTPNGLLMVRPDTNLPIVETEPSDAFRLLWLQVQFHAAFYGGVGLENISQHLIVGKNGVR